MREVQKIKITRSPRPREVRDQEKSENGKYEINFKIQKYKEFEKMARNLILHHVIYGHCWELTNHILYGQSPYKTWYVKVGNFINFTLSKLT